MHTTEAMRELLRSGVGRSGVGLLLLLFAASVYVLITYPLDFGNRRWSNPVVWADNPKAVPPSWTNLWQKEPQVKHQVFETRAPDQVIETTGGKVHLFRFRLVGTDSERLHGSPRGFGL